MSRITVFHLWPSVFSHCFLHLFSKSRKFTKEKIKYLHKNLWLVISGTFCFNNPKATRSNIEISCWAQPDGQVKLLGSSSWTYISKCVFLLLLMQDKLRKVIYWLFCSCFSFHLRHRQLSTPLLNMCRSVKVNIDERLEQLAWPPVKAAGCRNGVKAGYFWNWV